MMPHMDNEASDDLTDSAKVDTVESSEDNENCCDSSKGKPKRPVSLLQKLGDIPDVLDYIILLEKFVKKQRKRLRKLKEKFKEKIKKDGVVSIGVQTDISPTVIESININSDSSNSNLVPQSETPKTLAEEITEAAELATQKSGFVYDEVSGMYYDSNTGYYYSAEYGLYYDASTGTYMSFKQETNTYEFHSRVPIAQPQNNEEPQPSDRDKDSPKKRKQKNSHEIKDKCPRLESGDEAEEGECSVSSDTDVSDVETLSDTDISDIARQWPPCMRIIVEQSNVPKVKIGSLHILTFEGGTLGREGEHAVLLPDINISKCHLRFMFDKELNHYLVTDLGSRNGTILNGKRMAASKQESEALEVAHGSRIQVGSVVLLCHVHEGTKTCGHCEPGLLQLPEKKEVVIAPSRSDQHKTELKKLRKKFGVSGYEENTVQLGTGYTDRAQKRRTTVGSQNPHEKTEVASVTESISSQNKGFKMLAKMGWKEGESLGKDNQGIVEPVAVVSNPGTSGIGSTSGDVSTIQSDHIGAKSGRDASKLIVWKKTQERFKKLPEVHLVNNVFQEEDSD